MKWRGSATNGESLSGRPVNSLLDPKCFMIANKASAKPMFRSEAVRKRQSGRFRRLGQGARKRQPE